MNKSMTSRDKVRSIIARKNNNEVSGFWLGNPDPATWPIFYDYFGTDCKETIRQKLGDDFRWICTQHTETVYQHPAGKPIFDIGQRKSLDGPGPLSEAKSIKDVEGFDWPNPDYLNFDECLEKLDNAGQHYRASGFWCCFFHDMADLFGMENYLINMHLKPELVHAASNKIGEFYYEANKRFFDIAGDKVDAFFFGNDFGTQSGLICGRKQFNEFILPWTSQFVELAKNYGHQVILHSCGAIHDVIEVFIDLGIDCLHPIQAQAKDMDAETLSKDFGGRISFMGGIDTQDLLVNGSIEEIKSETKRIKEILSPHIIISPSHEAILPNVAPEKMVAVADVAKSNES